MPVATDSVAGGVSCPPIVTASSPDTASGMAASRKVTVRELRVGPTGGRTQASCSTVAQATPSTSMPVTVTPVGNA